MSQINGGYARSRMLRGVQIEASDYTYTNNILLEINYYFSIYSVLTNEYSYNK